MAGEHHAGLEARVLVIGPRLDQPELLQVADQGRHAVIAQAPGVEAGRYELGAERMHLDQRGQMSSVAEIEGVSAARQRRACRRLDRDCTHALLLAQRLADEWE